MVQELGREDDVDKSYYKSLTDTAIEAISQYCDFEWFVSDDEVPEVAPFTKADNAIVNVSIWAPLPDSVKIIYLGSYIDSLLTQ